jgi:hypothetical protein
MRIRSSTHRRKVNDVPSLSNQQLQIKVLCWSIGVVGGALFTIILYVGMSFDVRLSRIETILMNKQVAQQQSNDHPHVLAQTRTE